jgi:hypothetical protein
MRGAVALHQEWLKVDTLPDVAVYVVWSPQLGAQEKHVASATGLIPDKRVKHYWDGGMLVGAVFQSLVGSSGPAWDAWFVFDKDAMWKADSTFRPAWWEHQLRAGPPELMLDAKRWASHAIALHDIRGTHR